MRLRRALSLISTGLLVLAGATVAAPTAGAHGFGYQDLTPLQKRLVSGTYAEAQAGQAASRAATVFTRSAPGCDDRRGSNVKVNQNCPNVVDPDQAGRSQAQNETWIAANPARPSQMVVSYNDYRRGDGTCGASYSGDGGARWADATLPTGYTRGTAFGGTPREYWQGGGDTAVAWDTRGNLYLLCLLFKRGVAVTSDPDRSSGIYIFRSTGTAGASFNFPARPVAEHDDRVGAGNFLLDKPLMTVDGAPSSPFRDRVYVTWTTFAADGTAYIHGAYSADYGETFSAPVLISADSALCPNDFGVPTPSGRCNVNQFSQPVAGPDGRLYVVWNNFNNALSGAGDNRSQVLIAVSSDGGASFSPPVKAGDYYDLPDCPTYQNGANPGRACIPEKGATATSFFRAVNYAYVAVSPRDPARVSVAYGSYISRNSRETSGCTPTGFAASGNNLYDGVKTGGCNNDIVLSESTDGGATFTGGAADVRDLPSITDRPGQRTTDQYFHGLDYTPTGRLVATYYDRQYGRAATTGASDISVSARSGGGFAASRVTTSSMPPPSQFDGTFFGDYIQLDTTATTAYPAWVDSRPAAPFRCPGTGVPGVPPAICTATAPNVTPANDQEVFTARVPLP
jgi:hypothetical protein